MKVLDEAPYVGMPGFHIESYCSLVICPSKKMLKLNENLTSAL